MFYLGAAFLALLALQWWNAGRVMYFDPFSGRWAYTAPVRAGWPSAYTREEAAEMLRWFFPAWSVVMALRSGVLHTHDILRLWRWTAVASAVLAAVGLYQQIHATPVMYGLESLRQQGRRFFAGFGYENHAASYFVLMAALSAGLFMRDALGQSVHRRRLRMALMLTALLLNMAAVYLSLSRGGMFVALGLVGATTVYLATRVWKRLSPAARVNLVAGSIAVPTLAIMLVLGFGKDRLAGEWSFVRGQDYHGAVAGITGGLGHRQLLAESAWTIWKSNPVYGVGGWGCRYELPALLRGRINGPLPEGFANIHHDPLQFLAEFGLLGAGALAIICLVLLWPCLRATGDYADPGLYGWVRPELFFALIGLLLVYGHSLFDLPFRCPVVLWSWSAVLAGAGMIARQLRATDGVNDG